MHKQIPWIHWHIMKLIRINGVVIVGKKDSLSVITMLRDKLMHICDVQLGRLGHGISLNNFTRTKYQPALCNQVYLPPLI
jgi:hypothetical protein